MEILKQFGINPVLLAAQVVNFLILLFILKKFLYKPILKVLEERRKKIEVSLKNAEAIEKRLLEANQEYEKILNEALEESRKILNQSKEAGIQIMEESKETAARIIQKATEQALEVKKTETGKIEQEVRKHLGALIVLAFEKVAGKAMKKDQKAIFEREVKNLS